MKIDWDSISFEKQDGKIMCSVPLVELPPKSAELAATVPPVGAANNRNHVIALRSDIENVVRGLDGSEKIDDIVNRIMDRIAQRTGVR